MSELKWKWAYGPYLDPPEGQKESAIKAGYVKVVSKQLADEAIAKLKSDNADLRDDKKLTDAILDERNAEIAELKAEIKRKEGVGHRWFERCMAERIENVRLKRALWLARAERAEARKNYWYVRSIHEGDKNLWSIDGSAVKYIGCIKRKNFEWLKVWSEVEIKCRAKAEEYK